MPIFSSAEKKIFFVHIPKTGGSSVERIAADLGWKESFSVRGLHLRDLGHYKSSFQHLHFSVLDEIFNWSFFDYRFAIVRNPFYRFRSEYYWQLRQKITSEKPSKWIIDTISRYRDNNYLYDNHIRPQHEFVSDGVFNVFKLEEGGVEEARQILLNFNDGISFKRRITNKIKKKKKDKITMKDDGINSEFLKEYDRIRLFYEMDYRYFSYPED